MNKSSAIKDLIPCRLLNLYYAGLTGLLLICSGCTHYYVTPDDFKEHVFDVFKRQNNAIGEVMILTEDEMDNADYDRLLEAEKRMLEACKPLNEYAVLKRDDLNTDLFLYQEAMNAAGDCEDSTSAMETILQKFNDEDNLEQSSAKLPDTH
jgi:hypothetical protein